MNRFRLARTCGFTLIELMVTVAIVGILAAIAYPAYTTYLIKSNRSAAQAHLMALAQAEGQYMADSRTFADSLDALAQTTPATVADKYRISIAVDQGPPASYTITATPIAGGRQASDVELKIKSDGTRSPADKW
jgi:type IV pilus assembly protein PilE